jgi:hypothetical protein
MTKRRRVCCAVLRVNGQSDSMAAQAMGTEASRPSICLLSKEAEVDFEYSLEEPHVCTLVKTNLELSIVLRSVRSRKRILRLMPSVYLTLQQIEDKNLCCGKGKHCTLLLEVLVLALLSAIGSFYVHYQKWVGRCGPAHPYTLCGLSMGSFVHDIKGSPKYGVEEGTCDVFRSGKSSTQFSAVCSRISAACGPTKE